MAETHVVSGLAAKRSELTGLILDYQKKIDQMRAAVGHLDASIKLFAPDYDLRKVRAKAPRQRNSYFKPDECQRLVLEIFRDAGGTAPSSRQIGDQLVQRKGFQFRHPGDLEHGQRAGFGGEKEVLRHGSFKSHKFMSFMLVID